MMKELILLEVLEGSKNWKKGFLYFEIYNYVPRCENDCKCAFAVTEVEVKDVMKVADSALIMPPKSTWFEPKPRSGAVVRVFKN